MKIDPRITKTFYDWCVENNRMDLNDRFDEEKNRCTTKDVGHKSNSKFWFKCPRGLHESEQYVMHVVTRDFTKSLVCRKCNSVAQFIIDKFGEDYLWDHWRDDNELSPWDIPHASSTIKVKLQCVKRDYHKYEQVACSFVAGNGCPYCINRLIHPSDSLAAVYPEVVERWSEKNGQSPWEYSPHTDKKVWFKCPKEIHDDYEQQINNAVTYGFSCRECSIEETRGPEDLTGMTFGRLTVVGLDLESPQSVTKDGYVRYRWWCKCSCGNPDLKSVIGCHLTSGKIRSCGCLVQENCSQLQLKVEKYIQNNHSCQKINHEYNCDIIAINPKTNRQLPYDNEVIFNDHKKLIVEVMGESHYKIDLFTIQKATRHGTTPEQELAELQWRDEYKKQYSISQGYHYLAIPYWTEQDESYKTLIDQKIQEILTIQN